MTKAQSIHAQVYLGAIHESAEKRVKVPSTDIKDLPYQGINVTAITFSKTTVLNFVDAEWIAEKELRNHKKAKSKSWRDMFTGNDESMFVRAQPHGTIYPLKPHDNVITWKDGHYETVFTAPALKYDA